MASQEQVAKEEETRLTEDWQNEFSIPSKYKDPRHEFLQLLFEFEAKQDGPPDHIKTVMKRIEMTTSDIRTAYSIPYCTGPTARQFAAMETQRMLQEIFIELDNREMASPIVCRPKNMAHCDTASTTTISAR